MSVGALSGTGCSCVTLGAAAGTVLAAWAFLSIGPPAVLLRATRLRAPMVRPDGYDALDLQGYLRAAGPEGRSLYRRALRWDLGFVAVSGTGLILLLMGTWWRVLGPGHALLEALALAPGAIAAVAGFAEDLLLLRVVAPGTEGDVLRRADLVGAASWLTRIKLAAAAAAVLAVLAGAVTLAFAGTNRF